jgi:hypothetical protein
MMQLAASEPVRPAYTLGWAVLWGVILTAVYLPSLGTGFDFADDGPMVYPRHVNSLAGFADLVWTRTQVDFHCNGPFRPVAWGVWSTESELFQASPLTWRIARHLWSIVAGTVLLLVFREFQVRPWPAVAAAALALWNPFRNEIWLSLTYSEGVAMPFALASLICAVRAARAKSPLAWDVAGVFMVLIALGCKNTFSAMVPVQALLRISAGEGTWAVRLKKHGLRAGALLLTLLFPLVHFCWYRSEWHPGQYQVGFTWDQLPRFGRALGGAISYDCLAPALIAALVCVWLYSSAPKTRDLPREYWVACGAGLFLLVLGTIVYLPIGSASGRYTMPAIWGADLLIAVLLSAVAILVPPLGQRIVCVAFFVGLIAIAVPNVGKQEQYAARLKMLWKTLYEVEHIAPAGARIAWVGAAWPNDQEGVHFASHVQGRGRSDLQFQAVQATHATPSISVAAAGAGPPSFVITGSPTVFERQKLLCMIDVPYWFGLYHYRSYLWAVGQDENQQGEIR